MKLLKALAMIVLVPALSSCTKTPPTIQSPGSGNTPLVSAPADPSWQELKSFLGVDKKAPELKKFITKYQLSETTKGPSGSFSTEGSSAKLLYDDNVVTRVIIRPQHLKDSPLKAYQGELPYGLTRQDTIETVLRKFGTPSYQQGTDFLSYSDRRLWCGFLYGTICEITLDWK